MFRLWVVGHNAFFNRKPLFKYEHIGADGCPALLLNLLVDNMRGIFGKQFCIWMCLL